MVVVPLARRSAARAKAQESKVGSLSPEADRTAIAWGEHSNEPKINQTLGRPARAGVIDPSSGFMAACEPWVGASITCSRVCLILLRELFRGVGIPVIEGYGLTDQRPNYGKPAWNDAGGICGYSDSWFERAYLG